MDSQKIFDAILVIIGILAIIAVVWPTYLGIVGEMSVEESVKTSADTLIGFAFGPLIFGSNLLGYGGVFIPIGFLILLYWVYRSR